MVTPLNDSGMPLFRAFAYFNLSCGSVSRLLHFKGRAGLSINVSQSTC